PRNISAVDSSEQARAVQISQARERQRRLPGFRFPRMRTPMIERRPFEQLPGEDLGWLKARRHFCSTAKGDRSASGWGCMRVWNDEEIAPNAGFALQARANIEIIIYVREGTVTHRDSLGNEGRIEAGNVQVVSAGTGIRHAEYNLEQATARIFQMWIAPASSGGSPAWGVQPCPVAEHSGCFVAIAS